MAINVGSLPISTDTSNWLKVRSAISDSSVRATIAKIVEREVSKSKTKWINDLEIAASERGLTTEDLWLLLVNGQTMPDPINSAEVIKIQIKQRDDGKLHKSKPFEEETES